jgi:hypothetical protein
MESKISEANSFLPAGLILVCDFTNMAISYFELYPIEKKALSKELNG